MSTNCCPQCGSPRLYKAGFRYLPTGEAMQRLLCRNCGHRSTEKKHRKPPQKTLKQSLNTDCALVTKHQLSVILQEAKKLEPTAKTKTVVGEQIHENQETKGKIVEYLFYMEKQGSAKATIKLHSTCLRVLEQCGANLADPESVKEVLAKGKNTKGLIWSSNRKINLINAYSMFLKFQNLQWQKPKCRPVRPVPFIPTEQELDSLIAGCGKKLSAFLQLLKETAMRSGEAKRLLWTEIDAKANTIRFNNPEKGSNPRIWQVSPTLIGMLNALPKTDTKVFGAGPVGTMKSTYWKTRKGLAYKLQNPRLLKISFHTFRHWKATMLYHEKPDTLYVRDFLGHKELRNTERYITIARTIFGPGTNDKFIIKIAANAQEAIELGENGFEPFDVVDGVRLYRKRK